MAKTRVHFLGFQKNLKRTRGLVALYSESGLGAGRGRKAVECQDVLRAAVVFLHAALEEYFRSLVVERWPSAGPDVLNDVPLLGVSEHGRAEKFLLGRLAYHRHKTVQQLIVESVQAHADIMTINGTSDIAKLAEKLGIKAANVNRWFTTIDDFMQRRHHIVHQADKSARRGAGHHEAQSLSVTQVNRWTSAVEDMVSAVEAALPPSKIS